MFPKGAAVAVLTAARLLSEWLREQSGLRIPIVAEAAWGEGKVIVDLLLEN
jgi:hypothetical protein